MAKKKTLISLDIGSREIKAVAGTVGDGKLKVAAMKSVTMPPEVYSNGLVLNEQELRRVLQELLRSFKTGTKDVAISFETNEVIKREVLVPVVDPADLANLLRFEITDHLPIDIDNYVMQHRVLGTTEENKQRVMVAAIPEAIVGGLFRIISSIGYDPVLMDLHSNGIEDLIAASGAFRDGNYALIDFGARYLNVLMFENGQFVFNRIISLGLHVFDGPLAKLQGTPVLREYGLTGLWLGYRYGDLGGREMPLEQRYAVDEVVLSMDQILEEIDKIFKFYISRESRNAIHRIRLYGGGALLHAVTDIFERKFEIHTSILELSDLVGVAPARENALFVNAAAIMPGGF